MKYLYFALLACSPLCAQIVNPPAGSGTINANTSGNASALAEYTTTNGTTLQSSHVCYGITNGISCPQISILGGAATSTDGLILQLTSSNPDQTAILMQNSTSSVSYGIGPTGSNSAIPGFIVGDFNSGAVNFNFHSTDATHPINAMSNLGVLGFASGDPTATALISGLSSCGAGCFAAGTGGQGAVDGSVHASTGAFGTVTATGNVNVQGTVNSTANTSPASITNSGVALSASPSVADVVYYDSTRTTNNHIADALWLSGSYSLRFKSDDQASAATFFSAAGGQASGITGITSNSGSGSWVHTGGFSAATLTSTVATGTSPISATSTTPIANIVVAKHPTVQYCGISNACTATSLGGTQIVYGTTSLAAGTVVVSGISPAFIDTAYVCTVNSKTAASATIFNFSPTSTTSFTINGTAAATDTIGYICIR